MDISIIIVNYNTAKHLKKCLDSLFEYSTNLKIEVIVVDNNSTDREISIFPTIYPSVNFLFRDVNEGFGSGCNFGSKYATGKYLLFVNPDVTFISDINDYLFKFMENNSNVAIVSPLYNQNNNEIMFTNEGFPGYIYEISKAFGLIISKLFYKIFPGEWPDVKKPFEVNWVMGSFIFVRSDIFKKINGFDERFFLYYEDIDLQYRIKSIGYKIFYYSKVGIRHVKFSSVRTYNGENLYYYHMTRSNIIYMYKHFGYFKRNLIRCLYLIGIILRFIIIPFRKSFTHKKKQKLLQNILDFKQYISRKNKIYQNKYFKPYLNNNDETQVVYKDTFWQHQ